MKSTLIVGDSHVYYLQSLRKVCPYILLLGVVGRTMYSIDKFTQKTRNLVRKHNIQNVIVLMGTNDISGLLLYFKHHSTRRNYSTAFVKNTLQKSLDHCVRFCEMLKIHTPNIRIFLCNVFREQHAPHIILWNTYQFLLQSKCNTPLLARKYLAFRKTFAQTDLSLRTRSYYTDSFFRTNISSHDQRFIEAFVQHYHRRLRWFNAHLKQRCVTNGYGLVNLSRHVDKWGGNEVCAKYRTAFSRVLQKQQPHDMHYISELMAIALLRSLAVDTNIITHKRALPLTKRLYTHYSSRRKQTAKQRVLCRFT